jgi:hypothetical protein
MYQTILSKKRIDSRIIQKLNDTEKLFLFDRVKTTNQEDRTCEKIRKILQKNKKSYDEMLLKRFKSIENILFFKKKAMNARIESIEIEHC